MRSALPVRVLALGFTLLLVTVSARAAAAEVRFSPGADGSLGAWLLAGPLSATAASAVDGREPGRGAFASGTAGPRWKLAFSRSTSLDVADALGVGKQDGPRAVLGGVLSLEHDLDGWLWISADGGARVTLDGRPVWERDVPRLRGSSWDAVPVSLGRGRHVLLVHLHHRGEWWAVAVRILDRATLTPPEGLSLVLPGTDDADTRTLRDSLLDVSAETGLGDDGYVPSLRLAYPRGMPLGDAPRVSVRARFRSGAPLYEVTAGSLGTTPLFVTLPRVEIGELGPGPSPLALDVQIGDLHRAHTLTLSAAALRAGQKAASLALGVGTPPGEAETVLATLEQRRAELAAAGSGPTDDGMGVASATSALEQALDGAGDGLGLLHAPGVHDLALRSRLDARPERMVVQVPAGDRPGGGRRFPLSIVLHGLGSNGTRVMRAFLDTDSRAPRVNGFVVAPHAFGDAFYRGVGETAVIEALDWALGTYPIDAARVTITGVSMGGTGTAHVALRYPERFAAAAPLCGYHSFFIRKDVKDRPIRDWETALMQHLSPASWAASGRNLPLYVAQGTKDYPHENGKTLIEAYRKLGFRVTEEWPDIGHNVHEKVWDGAQQWPWLAAAKHDPAPSHVSLITDALRYGSLHFLHVLRLARPGRAGSVDAQIVRRDRVQLTTTGVVGVALDRGGAIDPGSAVSVGADGLDLGFGAGEPLALHRESPEATWQKGQPASGPHDRKAGVEGPIGDVFLGPVSFVWGAGDRATARVNREVAEALARRFGAEVRFPIVADTAASDADLRGRALVLVGTPRDHRILAEVSAALPIGVDGGVLRDGDRRFDGAGTGAMFVQPDPRNPERLLLVVTGVDVPGVLRALSLPALLPDYVVYDAGVAPAAAQQVLGSAHVLAGGFFRHDWSPTPDDGDPIPPVPATE